MFERQSVKHVSPSNLLHSVTLRIQARLTSQASTSDNYTNLLVSSSDCFFGFSSDSVFVKWVILTFYKFSRNIKIRGETTMLSTDNCCLMPDKLPSVK